MAAVNDGWDVKDIKSTEKQWSEKNGSEKGRTVLVQTLKALAALGTLYCFIISLSLMGSAFTILGGKQAGRSFRNSELFDNPLAGLVMGVLATVLVQSSSTSTSIIITMTAAGLMEVKNAIPMIMGANIGTSVTNTIVSIAQIGNRDEYRRAFAGATVHDCFNLLTVVILLPVEICTGLLKGISDGLVDAFDIDGETEAADTNVDFLKKVTKPVTSRLVQVDKKLPTNIAKATDEATLQKYLDASMIVQSKKNGNHMFMDTPMSDETAGVLLLVISLIFLSTCLILLVKLLQSIFRGRTAIWMQSLLNLEFKSVPFLADYVLVFFGIVITILMQSSSITTSTLTPLVGIGLIKLEKMLPFTVGANIGTTVTGVLAALASSNVAVGLKVSFAHLFFNLIGTLIWFPIPFLRRVPLAIARLLGGLAADLKWFPFAYVVFVFGALPAVLFGASLASIGFSIVVIILLALVLGGMILLMVLRQVRPNALPASFQKNPSWLPRTLACNMGDVEEEAVVASMGDADLGAANSWREAPAVWGMGTFVLLALVMAVPNSQWGNILYPTWDDRTHVGIGAWSACSAMYKEDMNWARVIPACSSAEFADCAGGLAGCDAGGFSDEEGTNTKYEKSWSNCSETCTTQSWEQNCVQASCGGSKHQEQCKNVTEVITPAYTVSHKDSSTLAWTAGDACRDVSELCDNDSSLLLAGNLAWAGTACVAIAQMCLLVYQFLHKSRPMANVLYASLALFSIAWVLLLVSWIIFTAAVGGDVECIVLDVSTTGAVVATGKFGDIINERGSYSYGFVIGSWIFVTFIIAGLIQRAVFERNKQQQSSGSASPAEPPLASAPDTKSESVVEHSNEAAL